jgi:hypothetical protein
MSDYPPLPTEENAEKGPTFAAPEPQAVPDLSKEIAKTVTKSAGETVTCRRISGNNYRCNWWSAMGTGSFDNPNMASAMVTTHRVSRSEMLRVTRSPKGLVIETVGAGPR